ncbi:MAG TPA: hypothetical protein VKQ32_10645 [Polyangia bacterium]|nr:hypothetical protein [Polyangia bacterium]
MRRGKMRIIKGLLIYRLLRKRPMLALLPFAPALGISALVMAIRALGRVKRLEQRLPAAAV